MSIKESIAKRRTYYQINKTIPVEEKEITTLIKDLTELVPDAFNMKSARVVVALGKQQDALWDTIYNVFGGKVSREKLMGLKRVMGLFCISMTQRS